MTTNEKRFYAFAKSIVKEPDPNDMIPIFKSKHWEMVGMYNNTYYVIYVNDEGEKLAMEFEDLKEALHFHFELAGGKSLYDYLKSIDFWVAMGAENEMGFQLPRYYRRVQGT